MRNTLIWILLSSSFSIISSQSKTLLDSAYTTLHRTRIVNADEEIIRRVKINDQYVSALITGNDTIVIVEIENINISSPRTFKDRAEYFRYLKYRRYAAKVYHFAKEAIRSVIQKGWSE